MEYLKLLQEIQNNTGTSIIFITHDFGIVSRICNRAAVMYAGKIVEIGPTLDIMHRPIHPYTIALVDSLPHPDLRGKRLRSISGQPPDPINLLPNCAFAPRCPQAEERCFKEPPCEVKIDDNHYVSCFHAK